MNVSDIISAIPEILIYYIPGFIGLSFVQSVLRYRLSSGVKTIMSCALSYIGLAICQVLFYMPDIWSKTVASVFICLIMAVVFIVIVQNAPIRSFLVFLFNWSPAADVISDSINIRKGNFVRLILKRDGMSVEGVLHSYNLTAEDPWMSIHSYAFYEDNRAQSDFFFSSEDGNYFLVHMNEIAYMEIFERDESDADS